MTAEAANADRFAGWPPPLVIGELSLFSCRESAAARAEVFGWAQDLYEDQLQIWRKKARLQKRNKPRPPTWDECIAKSREIRKKRERDATYRNDTTNPYA